MKYLIYRCTFIIAMTQLTACDLSDTTIEEWSISKSGRSGWADFTYSGMLPAGFGVDITAFYSPNDPLSPRCRAINHETGKIISRRHAETWSVERVTEPHHFNKNIPLSYYIGFCGMKLTDVKSTLMSNAPQLPQQQVTALGHLQIIDKPLENHKSDYFDSSINIVGQCRWLFKKGNKINGINALEKAIDCKNLNQIILRQDITNNSVNLAIKIETDELPAAPENWMKTKNGWRPCQGGDTSEKCDSSELPGAFWLDQKYCSVYPTCSSKPNMTDEAIEHHKKEIADIKNLLWMHHTNATRQLSRRASLTTWIDFQLEKLEELNWNSPEQIYFFISQKIHPELAANPVWARHYDESPTAHYERCKLVMAGLHTRDKNQ